MSGAKRRKYFVVLLHFFVFQVQSVVLVSASVWSVQFDQFLVFFVLTLGAPVPCDLQKWGSKTCHRALYGVSITFVLQFHTKKRHKTAIRPISECIIIIIIIIIITTTIFSAVIYGTSHMREFTVVPLGESRSAPGGRQLVGQSANLTLESPCTLL